LPEGAIDGGLTMLVSINSKPLFIAASPSILLPAKTKAIVILFGLSNKHLVKPLTTLLAAHKV
jgi:hypothetical protein